MALLRCWQYSTNSRSNSTSDTVVSCVLADHRNIFNCSYKTKFKNELKVHMMLHKCNHCSSKSKQKRDLQNQIINKHTPSEEITRFYCSQYSYKCKLHLLKRHKSKHNDAARCYKTKLKMYLQVCMYSSETNIHQRHSSNGLNANSAQKGLKIHLVYESTWLRITNKVTYPRVYPDLSLGGS